MVKSKKISCVITGKSTVYSGDFLAKKIEEYGNEANLDKLYICREVKTLLKKGYKCKDIRKILNVPEDDDLPPSDVIELIEKDYQKNSLLSNESLNQTLNTVSTLTYDKSDKDVEIFMNSYILKRSQ
jgi:DNA-binding transcriptional MerR regulator